MKRKKKIIFFSFQLNSIQKYNMYFVSTLLCFSVVYIFLNSFSLSLMSTLLTKYLITLNLWYIFYCSSLITKLQQLTEHILFTILSFVESTRWWLLIQPLLNAAFYRKRAFGSVLRGWDEQAIASTLSLKVTVKKKVCCIWASTVKITSTLSSYGRTTLFPVGVGFAFGLLARSTALTCFLAPPCSVFRWRVVVLVRFPG